MRRFFILLPLITALALASCSSKLTSTGESIAEIEKSGQAAVGKDFTVTLSQINVERMSAGPYLRLFDKDYKTIFVYVKKEQKNKIANLERNGKYIYKFKIPKYDPNTTFSGELMEVAGLDGKPVSGTLKDPAPTAVTIVIDGPEAVGKEFTLSLTFVKADEAEGKKVARFTSTDPYQKEVTLAYADDMKAKIDGLKADEKHKVKFKLDNVDWRLFGTLVSVE